MDKIVVLDPQGLVSVCGGEKEKPYIEVVTQLKPEDVVKKFVPVAVQVVPGDVMKKPMLI